MKLIMSDLFWCDYDQRFPHFAWQFLIYSWLLNSIFSDMLNNYSMVSIAAITFDIFILASLSSLLWSCFDLEIPKRCHWCIWAPYILHGTVSMNRKSSLWTLSLLVMHLLGRPRRNWQAFSSSFFHALQSSKTPCLSMMNYGVASLFSWWFCLLLFDYSFFIFFLPFVQFLQKR